MGMTGTGLTRQHPAIPRRSSQAERHLGSFGIASERLASYKIVLCGSDSPFTESGSGMSVDGWAARSKNETADYKDDRVGSLTCSKSFSSSSVVPRTVEPSKASSAKAVTPSATSSSRIGDGSASDSR
jgi:hypothetical protein